MSEIDFDQKLHTITGSKVLTHVDGDHMDLRSYCIEAMCAQAQGQPSAKEQMRASAIALRLVNKEELKDGDLTIIIARTKEYSSKQPAIMGTVLPLLGVALEEG